MANRLPPEKRPITPGYRQVWRVVDGAVDLALTAHPEYLAPKANVRTVRNSIVKRVTGAATSYLAQAGWTRSDFRPAGKEAGSALHGPAAGDERVSVFGMSNASTVRHEGEPPDRSPSPSFSLEEITMKKSKPVELRSAAYLRDLSNRLLQANSSGVDRSDIERLRLIATEIEETEKALIAAAGG